MPCPCHHFFLLNIFSYRQSYHPGIFKHHALLFIVLALGFLNSIDLFLVVDLLLLIQPVC